MSHVLQTVEFIYEGKVEFPSIDLHLQHTDRDVIITIDALVIPCKKCRSWSFRLYRLSLADLSASLFTIRFVFNQRSGGLRLVLFDFTRRYWTCVLEI